MLLSWCFDVFYMKRTTLCRRTCCIPPSPWLCRRKARFHGKGHSMDDASAQQLIVIGASVGGVEAMLAIAAGLPPGFAAPILYVQHIGAHRSYLPELISARGPNAAVTARDGDVPCSGTIYVAPPDHHLLLEGGALRIWRGPKENHARPAIDPLFRSAALACGSRVVGVVLTGLLDDGSAGLRAVKDGGGIAVVQDPADAWAPGMPTSALATVAADHVVPLAQVADLLSALAQPRHPKPMVTAPDTLRHEHAASFGATDMQDLKAIGSPSIFTCPDCGGTLFELHDKRPIRFVCHTGHAFSLRSLASTQERVTEEALWTSLRALQEKEAILRRLAQMQAAQSPGSEREALKEADELSQVIASLRAVMEKAPSNQSFDVPS
jgi:two-component system chemotaxis response regulator CheB